MEMQCSKFNYVYDCAVVLRDLNSTENVDESLKFCCGYIEIPVEDYIKAGLHFSCSMGIHSDTEITYKEKSLNDITGSTILGNKRDYIVIGFDRGHAYSLQSGKAGDIEETIQIVKSCVDYIRDRIQSVENNILEDYEHNLEMKE